MRALPCLLFAFAGCFKPSGAAAPATATELVADYVIVGAGSAGSVLADRLSEGGASVLVLEAGPPDDDPRIHDPASWLDLLGSPELHWQYATEPQPALEGRAIDIWQGKVWGGSSSHNAMFWVRGHASDFDGWNAPSWAWKDVEPYFARAEHVIQPVTHPANEVDEASLVAMRQVLGVAEWADGSTLGSGPYRFSEHDGKRTSTASAYLRPALQRPNVHVESHALVSRVVFEGKRAKGVEWIRDGATRRAMARREVILSAGAFGSPAILLRSGVGPATELEKLGIPVVADLPVGRNLQDHVQLGIGWAGTRPLTTNGRCHELCFGTGGFASVTGSAQPDIQLKFTWQPKAKAGETAIGLVVVLLHPKSRGEVTLRSTDPYAAPVIQPRYLTDPVDLDTLVAGIRLARKVGGAAALQPFRGDEIDPGPAATGDVGLRDYIRKNASTIWHPIGTCRMGDGDDAVVDFELRVRGLEGLRVVDASVMPTLTSGNTNAPTIMIAERAADLIKAAAK